MSGELEIIFKAVVSRVRSGVRWQQPLTWASAVTGVTDVCLLCLSKFSLCFFFFCLPRFLPTFPPWFSNISIHSVSY